MSAETTIPNQQSTSPSVPHAASQTRPLTSNTHSSLPPPLPPAPTTTATTTSSSRAPAPASSPLASSLPVPPLPTVPLASSIPSIPAAPIPPHPSNPPIPINPPPDSPCSSTRKGKGGRKAANPHLTDEERRRERVLKNRESAMKSLQKKKRYTEDLEHRAIALSRRNAELKEKIRALLIKLNSTPMPVQTHPQLPIAFPQPSSQPLPQRPAPVQQQINLPAVEDWPSLPDAFLNEIVQPSIAPHIPQPNELGDSFLLGIGAEQPPGQSSEVFTEDKITPASFDIPNMATTQ